MLTFVSDLHLADTNSRATIDVPYLIDQLRVLTTNAQKKKIQDLKIVLLGDIFEILKSKRWLDDEVRPWEPCTTKHVTSVSSIFDSIIESNPLFFRGLQNLVTEFPFVRLHYVPGNHDLPLNTGMGVKARERLTSALPLQLSDAQKFGNYLVDEAHGVIARHGHEWDSSNRYSNRLSAIGDAIVIDLLLRLPIIVSKSMGIDVDDNRLAFLHELDNVRPQSPRVMAQWILKGLDNMSDCGPKGRKAIEGACHEVAIHLKKAIESTRFESIEVGAWWLGFLTKLAPAILKHLGALTAARHLTMDDIEIVGPYREYAVNDFELVSALDGDFRYVICGHTHSPQLVPLDLVGQDQRARLYLNTGTWRRVHRFASVASGANVNGAFARWDEECLITIYNEGEQSLGLPAYEFSRITRGSRI
ncbi:MAG TPA: hypothetical protein VN696_14020 [Pyrinomonadaceae bacterium]|nr:hypothetical protein [Pyrinomonadaceae bacterium]